MRPAISLRVPSRKVAIRVFCKPWFSPGLKMMPLNVFAGRPFSPDISMGGRVFSKGMLVWYHEASRFGHGNLPYGL